MAAEKEAVATEKAVIADTTVDGAPVTTATTEAHGGEAHAKPKALGMDATMWVALAMLVVIALFIWKKVPAMIGAALDRQKRSRPSMRRRPSRLLPTPKP
jgi:F-type H+-transporting ATPase subunit b